MLVPLLLPLLLSESLNGVLVIGGTGRLGRSVCKLLREKNVETTVLVRDLATAQTLPELAGCELVQGNVCDLESLRRVLLLQKFASVISVHGTSPPRLSRLTDLSGAQVAEANHPATVNYQGVCNILAAMKEARVKRLVRVTGALAGKPNKVFCALFNLLLSFTVKYHELSEMAIRASGVEYAVIRPTGIRDEPSAASQNAALDSPPDATKAEDSATLSKRSRRTGLVALPGDGRENVRLPGKISVADLAALCVAGAEGGASWPPRSTLVVSTDSVPTPGGTDPAVRDTWAKVFAPAGVTADSRALTAGAHRRNALVLVAALVGSVAGAVLGLLKAFGALVALLRALL